MIRNELVYPTACKRFLDESTDTIRTPSSKGTYRAGLSQLQRRFPDRRVSEFTEDDLVAWCKEASAPGTILSRRKIVITFFKWATWRRLTERDPSGGRTRLVRPPRKKVKRHNWLSLEQLRAVLQGCDDGTAIGARDRVVIMVAVFTGLRRAELCALRWGHVDLTARTLAVFGKGEKPATVGLPPRLAEALFEWRGLCAKGLGRPPAAGDPVLPRGRLLFEGERICWDIGLGPSGVLDAVKRRGALAGVPSLAPHDLRRTFIDMVDGQQGLEAASRAARHSNFGTTQIYIEDSPRKTVQAGHDFDIAL